MHGKLSPIEHDGTGVFADLPTPFTATRYHSLVAEPESLPAGSRSTRAPPTARSWALRTRELPIHGVQFHPESIETEHGHRLLRNFLELVPASGGRHDRRAATGSRS